jgi:hypothetical protein
MKMAAGTVEFSAKQALGVSRFGTHGQEGNSSGIPWCRDVLQSSTHATGDFSVRNINGHEPFCDGR